MPRFVRAEILAFALLAVPTTAQQWRFLDGPVLPKTTSAFDMHRGRLVMFAGDGETWEYEGSTLLHRAVASPTPSPRTHATLVYDSARRHVLLFGGTTGQTALDDTWTYDGARWTSRANSGSLPSARREAAGTFDTARGSVLLFGGTANGLAYFPDTWTHDGAQWQLQTPATVPTLARPVLTFDTNRGVAVLAGWGSGQVQTYEWNGADWTLRSGGPAPRSTNLGTLVHDPLRGRCVLAGTTVDYDAIWEWDGTMWSRSGATLPRLRLEHAGHFDPASGKVVFTGGTELSVGPAGPLVRGSRSDAWSWDGTTLAPLHADRRAAGMKYAASAAHPGSGTTLVFGGEHRLLDYSDETRLWNGNAWTFAAPANRPPARALAAAASDVLRGQALLFGGFNGQYLGDLWAWNGSNWTQLANGPAPRGFAAMAQDPFRDRLVLFGGISSTQPLDDTWEWSGTAWARRQPLQSPQPRERAAMAFDFATARVVLYGGAGRFGDTWQWDGSNWSQAAPTPGMPLLLEVSMATDPRTLRPVLTGIASGPLSPPHETYEYGPSGWTLRTRIQNAWLPGIVVSDFSRGRLVLVTHEGIAEHEVVPAVTELYGAGCGSPAPRLMSRSRPRIGEVSFGLEVLCEPSAPVLFGASAASGNAPLPNGCALLLGTIDATVIAMADVNGLAVVPIPLPRDPHLAGVTLFTQAAALSSVSPGGFTATRGLRLVVGD